MLGKPAIARRLVLALGHVGIEASYEKTSGSQVITAKTRVGNVFAIFVESSGFTVWNIDGIGSFATDSYMQTLERAKTVHAHQ